MRVPPIPRRARSREPTAAPAAEKTWEATYKTIDTPEAFAAFLAELQGPTASSASTPKRPPIDPLAVAAGRAFVLLEGRRSLLLAAPRAAGDTAAR